MNLFSLFYHFLDNLVWYSNLGLISEYIAGNISLKTIKRLFSLLRNVLKLLLDLKKYRRVCNKVEDLNSSQSDEEQSDALKLKQLRISIIHSIIRSILLFNNLRVPPFNYINPIISDILSVVHSLLSVFKYYSRECIDEISNELNLNKIENEKYLKLETIKENESLYKEVLVELN